MPPESQEPQTALILLMVCNALLLVVVFMMLRISYRLSRMEKRLAPSSKSSQEKEPLPSSAETSPGGAFESFLEEEPARRRLPKNEQFAAYRKWRQEKGLNWSGS